jgi:serine/threonine protein kinase
MLGLEGTTIGHYRLQRRLGRGGMSEVYLAIDENTQQEVAIKLVSSSHTEYSERFRHEIETMRTLTHSHILPILDSGEHGPWHYLVMLYIRQGTLYERLRRSPLTLQEVGGVLEQVASALQFAHDHGIIHRDIKPSNILLHGERYVYLADFGLAKAIEDNQGVTQTDCLMGTPEYLAPELMDRPATTSSDIYALGIVLYEMVTGRVPFKASTPIGVCWKHLQEQPFRPSLLNPALPLTIEQVILCALEKDPHCRFKSVRALVQAFQGSLETAEQGEMVSALSDTLQALKIPRPATIDTSSRKQTMPKPHYPPSRVQRLLVAFTAFVFLLTTSLSLGLFVASNSPRTQVASTIGAIAPLVSGNRVEQKHITLTFSLTPHHLEGNFISSFVLQDYPRAKRPHSGGGNNEVGERPKSRKGHRHKSLPMHWENKGYIDGEGDWKCQGEEDGGSGDQGN